MGKKRIQPNYRRRTLRLPDLDHSKLADLNSLGSPGSSRVYEFALNQFITWYCSEPRLAFNRIVVTRYRMYLLGEDDEWLCRECWDRQVYFVAFDTMGGHIVHQDEFPWPSSDSEEKVSDAVTFGPFTSEEADEFLAETTQRRDRGTT